MCIERGLPSSPVFDIGHNARLQQVYACVLLGGGCGEEDSPASGPAGSHCLGCFFAHAGRMQLQYRAPETGKTAVSNPHWRFETDDEAPLNIASDSSQSST